MTASLGISPLGGRPQPIRIALTVAERQPPRGEVAGCTYPRKLRVKIL